MTNDTRSSSGNIAQKTAAKYITPIDPIELAIRLLEAAQQVSRPPNVSAVDAFFGLDKPDQDAWLRASHAAMEYWREQILALQATN